MADFTFTAANIANSMADVSEMISVLSVVAGDVSVVVTDAAKRGQKLLADIFMLAGYLPAKEQVFIEGYVAPGFEQVKHLFEDNFKKGFEKSAQLCVYVGEEKVVDSWGSVEYCSEFGPDTLVNIFSSSKSLTSIAMAKLVDSGVINYDMEIEVIWPEFASNGKTGVRFVT
jgi:CubicO group peptidase (beta-lactamase class C family)